MVNPKRGHSSFSKVPPPIPPGVGEVGGRLFRNQQELFGAGFRDCGFCRRVGGPGWRFVELTLPRSVQNLPRPGCFKTPLPPPPETGWPLFLCFGFANFPRRAGCRSGRVTAHPEARCTPDGTARPRVFWNRRWRSTGC